MTTRNVAVAVLAASLALVLACGKETPWTPPPVSTTTTTPPASGGGPSKSCALGKGSVSTRCSSSNSRLAHMIEEAINLLVQEKPQIFDLKDLSRPDSDFYKVLDTEAYLDGLVVNLQRQGACAERDSDDDDFRRILVKVSNEISETYDVLDARDYVKRTDAGYMRTCSPASFPIDRVGDIPPAGSGCGRPYPPPVTRFNCKVHVKAPDFYTLDSTPLVGPDIAYCEEIGYTDGRSICPLRAEGAPDRIACENWRVGKARDTGRYGPTWRNEVTGEACTGPASNCSNSEDSQYQLNVYRSGTFRATAESGAYGTVEVER